MERNDALQTRVDDAVREIGTDGAVIIRHDGTVETVDLKLGRKKKPTSKGSNRKPLAPKASDEMVAGYRMAQELAERRSEACAIEYEKRAWVKLGEYCKGMADSRALDDDQYRFQRDKQRQSRELTMDKDLMTEGETNGLSTVWETENQGVPEWKWLSMEIALKLLSPLQRVCYEMHYAGRREFSEIAEALGMAKGEVKKMVRRANRTFERKVKPMAKEIFNASGRKR